MKNNFITDPGFSVTEFLQKKAAKLKNNKSKNIAKCKSRWMASMIILFMVGLLISEEAFAEREQTIIKKQTNHEIQKERAVQLINPSGDPSDSFRRLTLKQVSGIPISVPIDANNNGVFVMQGRSRALQVTFDCDYSQGITRGEAMLSYQHPRNLYESISGFIVVECLPLTEEEKAQHIAINENRLREASLRRAEEERIRLAKLEHEEAKRQLQANAEAIRREEQAKEITRKASPLYKRELAEKNIKRMRAEIQAAEVRISEEQRVGNLSGYVDKRRLHELGSLIVAAEREIARNWVIYQENGGAARSVDSIR